MTDPRVELIDRFTAATHFIADDGYPAIRVLTSEESADLALTVIEQLLSDAKEVAMTQIIERDWADYRPRHAAEAAAYHMADTIASAVTREPLG